MAIKKSVPYIGYYGGKVFLRKEIIPIIESTTFDCYVEVCTGGGAIAHALSNKKVMVINDIFDYLINFYKVLKKYPSELIAEIDSVIHSRKVYQVHAKEWLESENTIIRATGYFILQNGYANKFNGGFCTSTTTSHSRNWVQKKNILKDLALLMDRYTVENLDLLDCITKYDSDHTLFYIDPPYPNTNQGHYTGYTKKDFNALLEVLRNIKGKFVLSSYRNNIDNLSMFTETKTINMNVPISNGIRDKTEFIGWNFKREGELF